MGKQMDGAYHLGNTGGPCADPRVTVATPTTISPLSGRTSNGGQKESGATRPWHWARMPMDAGNGVALPSSPAQTGRMPMSRGCGLTCSVLGLKIAQRMLEGVAPHAHGKTSEQDERIRVILACRSRARAEGANKKLRSYFPDRTLLLDIEDLDLCSMRNIEDFCSRLLARYPQLNGETDDEGTYDRLVDL